MSRDVTPTQRRAGLRYSLRTFLLTITAIAVVLGVAVTRARTQRDAIDKIQRLRGSMTYEYQEVAPRTWSSAGKPRGPKWLRRVFGPHYFDRPNRVDVDDPPNEQWAEAVNRLPSVKYLLVNGQNISDEALGRLTRLVNLWELQLTKTSIGDDGLKRLGQFPKLRWLVIDDSKCTDAGLAHLAAPHDLEELSLWNTPLTDAAVPHLSRLTGLKKLDVRGSGISDDGAEELRKALANCRVRK